MKTRDCKGEAVVNDVQMVGLDYDITVDVNLKLFISGVPGDKIADMEGLQGKIKQKIQAALMNISFKDYVPEEE